MSLTFSYHTSAFAHTLPPSLPGQKDSNPFSCPITPMCSGSNHSYLLRNPMWLIIHPTALSYQRLNILKSPTFIKPSLNCFLLQLKLCPFDSLGSQMSWITYIHCLLPFPPIHHDTSFWPLPPSRHQCSSPQSPVRHHFTNLKDICRTSTFPLSAFKLCSVLGLTWLCHPPTLASKPSMVFYCSMINKRL